MAAFDDIAYHRNRAMAELALAAGAAHPDAARAHNMLAALHLERVQVLTAPAARAMALTAA